MDIFLGYLQYKWEIWTKTYGADCDYLPGYILMHTHILLTFIFCVLLLIVNFCDVSTCMVFSLLTWCSLLLFNRLQRCFFSIPRIDWVILRYRLSWTWTMMMLLDCFTLYHVLSTRFLTRSQAQKQYHLLIILNLIQSLQTKWGGSRYSCHIQIVLIYSVFLFT
jgi:hypothetical protein